MKLHKRMLGIAAAVIAVVFVGCGGSPAPQADPTRASVEPPAVDQSAASDTADDASAPSDSTVGACKFVTTAEASALAGSAVKPGAPGSFGNGPVTFESCDYIFDPGNAPGVTVAVADLGGGSQELFAQFRQSKASESGYQAIGGVGDEAFFAGQNLYVRAGDKGLILYVGRSSSAPRGVDAIPDEKKLAASVLARL